MSGERIEAGAGVVTLHDLHPPASDLCADVASGLTGKRKSLPPKYFYDSRGADLFERITQLDAYYPTRTELAILERSMPEISRAIGPDARIVEFGSGSGRKTQLLLEQLETPVAYVPIDISRSQLVEYAVATAERFPALEVLPVCADYTAELALPATQRNPSRTVAFFPGSTIGNLEPPEAEAFLRRVAELCGPGGGLLIGIDLKKEAAHIERAYNDPEGVTAEFNLNLLRRVNRECGADFDLQGFRHHAFFDERHGRVEMRLVSTRDQTVHLPSTGGAGTDLQFRENDYVTTEYSYKHSLGEFRELAARAGWRVEQVWTDERNWFAEVLLGVA